ncbi:MAG TPA: hypothetical protein DD435_09605, partial [Cyanobacteria bacterium UBA8530]|nr:hypothetical protein [Cyanobacteria bacterium UBA8530]
RLLFLVLALNVVLTTFYTAWIYHEKRSLIYQNFEGKLTACAYEIAEVYDGRYQDGIIDGEKISEQAYRKILLDLSAQSKRLGVAYLYTMFKKKDGIYFSASSATDQELKTGKYTNFLEKYKEVPPEVEQSFQDRKNRLVLCKDEWGSFVSVFLPLVTPKGRIFISGADIRLDLFDRVLAETLWRAAGISFGAFLIFSILAYLLVSRISKPLGTLSRFAVALAENDFKPLPEHQAAIDRIAAERRDEIGTLASSVISMQTALGDYLETIRRYNQELEHKVAERTEELHCKNGALQDSLDKLKETQNQLIVQEKLASLGALTAGIAHEIKNPLNFVNNFSKLSKDLLQELQEEIAKKEGGDPEEISALIGDLTLNMSKIAEHGARADRIVKGMLQHARNNTGERQKTDLNGLLDEYVNLGYQGMRGQDSSFNLTFEKSYDPNVGLVNVVPQDFSRVVLNLVNNACYALQEKAKKQGEKYVPLLKVTSLGKDDLVEIRIRDNGSGIPRSVLDQIFNPFFTTKPAGDGTGLGLSISYDIVTQGHGGTFAVDSQEGEFTEFLITLPKKTS